MTPAGDGAPASSPNADLARLPELPGEVVTRALLRFIDLPFHAGRAALVTLDNGLDHTRPNTFGPGGLEALGSALDAIEASEFLKSAPARRH